VCLSYLNNNLTNHLFYTSIFRRPNMTYSFVFFSQAFVYNSIRRSTMRFSFVYYFIRMPNMFFFICFTFACQISLFAPNMALLAFIKAAASGGGCGVVHTKCTYTSTLNITLNIAINRPNMPLSLYINTFHYTRYRYKQVNYAFVFVHQHFTLHSISL
jgi:hypothetical protein